MQCNRLHKIVESNILPTKCTIKISSNACTNSTGRILNHTIWNRGTDEHSEILQQVHEFALPFKHPLFLNHVSCGSSAGTLTLSINYVHC
jgi:hypothetical protein